MTLEETSMERFEQLLKIYRSELQGKEAELQVILKARPVLEEFFKRGYLAYYEDMKHLEDNAKKWSDMMEKVSVISSLGESYDNRRRD
jgi:hypothetical protein